MMELSKQAREGGACISVHVHLLTGILSSLLQRILELWNNTQRVNGDYKTHQYIEREVLKKI